jgi:FkbM family methyltransferase
MEALLEPLGVTCVNAREKMNTHPMRNPLGWELKSYAILHTRFKEILFLDADNVALRNPEYLFETAEFKQTGALFWPDFGRLSKRRPIWRLCGVEYRDEPEFESGQILINKEKCWKAVNLAFWYNDHSEFYYRYIHGDKETFHMAWRKLKADYAMPPFPIHRLTGTMCQHDFDGNRIFQHRNLRKWSLGGVNEQIEGFQLEEECFRFLRLLRNQWDGRVRGRTNYLLKNGFKLRPSSSDLNIYENVVARNEYELPERFERDDVILDIGGHIGSFSAACHARGSRRIFCFEAEKENAEMARKNLSGLDGVQVRHCAILDRAGPVSSELYPGEGSGLNTGGARIWMNSSGTVRARSLDSILKKFGRVRLLKLDCEGSEWPILIGSRELHRVEAICGEYHEMEKHELCSTREPLGRSLLKKLLSKRFERVKSQLDKENAKLGKFWASCPKPIELL